jgi:hypothetical protein
MQNSYKLFMLTSKQLLTLHFGLVLLLLLLIPFETSLSPYALILKAGGAWLVDVRAAPLYGLRSALLLSNLLLSGCVLTAFFFGQALAKGWWEGSATSVCLTMFMSIVGIACAPFWVNGAHLRLNHFPIPGMDPKALPPAIWFPNPALWQMIGFGVILMTIAALFGSVVVGGIILIRERRMPFYLFLSQVALAALCLCLFFTPEIGNWFAD